MKILPVYGCWKTIGSKILSSKFLFSINWTRIGFPEAVIGPAAAKTVFLLRKVTIGTRKSLNMS